MPRRVGPYRVSERVGHVACRLSLPAEMKMHPVFHMSLLKPWKESGRLQPRPPRLLLDGQLVWTVDRILDDRTGEREDWKKFLIRWEGYDKANDLWEPEANIHDSQLVQDYWAMLQRMNSTRSSKQSRISKSLCCLLAHVMHSFDRLWACLFWPEHRVHMRRHPCTYAPASLYIHVVNWMWKACIAAST